VRKGATKIEAGHLTTHAPRTKNQSAQHCIVVDNASSEGVLGALGKIRNRNVDVRRIGHKIGSSLVYDAEP
jgi:hypothetical protein